MKIQTKKIKTEYLLEKEENYIQLNTVKLYYELRNKKLLEEGRPLLVFLHEGLGSVQQWKDFPEKLSTTANCPALLFDREGHGKSEMLTHPRSINFIHEQALKVLPEIFKALNIDDHPKILIGHSDGGSIAIIHAGSNCKNIIGIITEAAHVFVEKITVNGLKEAVKSFEEGILKQLLNKYHGENTESMFYGWANTWLEDGFEGWNIENYLTEIHVPFLAIQGKDDQYGTEKQLISIKKHCLGSEIRLIENCAHIPHQQQKEKVMHIISDFIKKLI